MSTTEFNVIIVGGGPVGLTAAHALEKAGIDFLLLEQRSEVAISTGSNLVLRPNGIQALMQLGLQEAIDAVSSPLKCIDRLDHNGNDLGGLEFFEMMKQHLGIYPRVISRHNLTKVLYETLSEQSKSKILTSKRLERIVSLPNGVEVTCTDGATYTATTLLGADGAHSRVRAEMRNLAIEHNSAEVNAEHPFLTTFQAIWIRVPISDSLKPGLTCETHGHGAATQVFAGDDSAVIGLYERLDEPTRERKRYTSADEQALVERWDALPIAPNNSLTLGEAYRSKIESGMISLEEGVVDHWNWAGRIVLAGDSAHKYTPSTGEGCNTGIIDVMSVMDEMYYVFHEARRMSGNPKAVPARAEITKAFQKYQAIRLINAQDGCARSGRATATALWSTTMDRFMDCHVISHPFAQRLLANEGIKKSVAPQKFAFLSH